MPSVKTEIHVLTTGISLDDDLLISSSLIKQLKIPTHRTLTLKFGSRKLLVQVSPIGRGKKPVLRIAERTANSLGLIDGDVLIANYSRQTQTLKLGPVIGVILPGSSHADRPFGNMTAYCEELHGASQLYGGFVYFFSPEDIRAGEITGWRFAHRRWMRMRFPIPDVVYNRLTKRKLENKSSVQQLFHEVKSRYQGHVFNEKYLDKNDVFAALARSTPVRKLLPESHLFTNYEQLSGMSKKYSSVFLKPVTGSLGKGIIRVSRSSKRLICQYTSVNGSVRKSYSSLSKAFPSIKNKVRGKRYLIQQGLTLLKIHDRPVDFRALVQKNRRGQWSITSIVGRTASNQSFVSNVARGGRVSPARHALLASNLPNHLQGSVYLRMKKAALSIAAAIEHEFPYHFAELGIDLAVDASGKIWLIEVNSKPSKSDGVPSGSGKIRPSVKKFLLYSRYLSGL